MKIKNLKINNSNVNIADEINFNAQTISWGINTMQMDAIATEINKLNRLDKGEIINLLDKYNSNPPEQKSSVFTQIKSRLVDFGISLAASLTSEGLIHLVNTIKF